MGGKAVNDHLIPAHFIDDETEKQKHQVELHLIFDYTSNFALSCLGNSFKSPMKYTVYNLLC